MNFHMITRTMIDILAMQMEFCVNKKGAFEFDMPFRDDMMVQF